MSTFESLDNAIPKEVLDKALLILAFLGVLILLVQVFFAGMNFNPQDLTRKAFIAAKSMLLKSMGGKIGEMVQLGLCLDQQFWKRVRRRLRRGELTVGMLFSIIVLILALAVGLYVYMKIGNKMRDSLSILG